MFRSSSREIAPEWSTQFQAIQFDGPWNDTPANRQAVETLLGDRRVEYGLRLVVVNLDPDHEGLLADLELAKSQIEQLLQQIPAG